MRTRLILGLSLCSILFGAEVRIARRPHAVTPREGQAINRLIAHAPKLKYRSETNWGFYQSRRARDRLDAVDTIRVLALRVEFQEDTSSLTTGNGKMDYAGFLTPDDGLLYDPPHTKLYFEKQLEFLKNYYALNSLGKCHIAYRVMPNEVARAYQLPHDMLYYGDTISVEGIETGLTRLMRDAVKAADEDPNLTFSDYDLLVIFHAGSTGQTDLMYNSPFDLLTGSLGEGALQAYLGEPYVLADEGRTRINAATILPEMARQDTMYMGETNILGMTGLQGLLVHEFNHLLGGLDVYDVTYRSMGVGSWSLMGYGGWLGDWGLGVPPGTIPSLLDPWHRVYYGWVEPVVANIPLESIPLFTGTMDTMQYRRHQGDSMPVIIKVPITPTEYFLIENRQQDVLNTDTLIVHVEYGVTVSVTGGEYDFFQPGSGVLIWHIDESVIEQFGPFNAINIFPERKGVDLVEGDGIQDYDGWSGRSQFDYQIYGSRLDPFFPGGFNDRLTSTTTPSSDGHTGRTHISIQVHTPLDTFSPVDSIMYVSVRNDLCQNGFPQDPLRNQPFNPATFADIDRTGRNQFIVSDTAGRISVWNSDGTTYLAGRSNGIFVQVPNASTHTALAVGDVAGDSCLEIVCATEQRRLYVYSRSGSYVTGFPLNVSERIRATPVLADLDRDGKQEIIFSTTDGWLHVVKGDARPWPGFPVRLGSELRSAVALTAAENPQLAVLASDGRLFLVNLDGSIAPGFPRQVGQGSLYTLAAPVIGDLDRDGVPEIVCVTSAGYDYRVKVYTLAGEVKFQSRDEIRNPFTGTPALADVDGDGYLDIIVTAKNFVYAFNRNGTLVSNYPFEQESTYLTSEVAGNWLITFDNPFLFRSSPVVADLDADGVPDVIAGSPHYGMLAFNGRTGRRLEFAPLATPGSVSPTPLVCDIDRDGQIELAAGSDDGLFHVWKLPGAANSIAWGGFLGDPQHTGRFPDDLLPEMPAPDNRVVEKFYCYPNPAPGPDNPGRTAIARFRLGNVTNASARIKLLDVTGMPLVELTAPALANADNERLFPVDVVPTGVYVVRLEVKSDQGSAVKFYKLAIVR